MSLVTTHVLDAVAGRPAAGVGVVLEGADGSAVADGITDDDGRITDLGPEELPAGVYRLVFATGDYFAGLGLATFYPSVSVTFTVVDRHCHVPLLLSPHAYSTYRGS